MQSLIIDAYTAGVVSIRNYYAIIDKLYSPKL